MRTFKAFRRSIEALAILVVYVFFVVSGMFGLQPALDLELLYPQEAAKVGPSPIILAALVSSRGKPIVANVTFVVVGVLELIPERAGSGVRMKSYTVTSDEEGIARVEFSFDISTHCSWSATAERYGYVPATSNLRSFDTSV